MNPFELSEQQVTAFGRPVLGYLPAGYDVEAAMRAEIDDVGSLAELASPDVVAARIDRLGADVSRRDLTERLLENTGAPDVIAGLRHRNLDPAFPFVAVKTTARVNNAEAVDVLAARVSQSYRGAGVRGFTFWEQPGLDFAGTENWATVMAGSVKTATRAGAEQDPGHPLTAFWPDDATDLIPGYHREQRAWRADAPGLAPFVSESSQEALQAAADLGLLMTLRDRHGFAGLAAATIAPLFGRRAVCMLDVFLADRLRGTGLAPVMHSWFLAGQRSGADTVWGHIHAGNLPSLRTAQKLGRRPVQQEYFVSLPV
ncbi:hypothetical protein VUN84_08870 [Micrococcaceae bacterium Sec5.8]